MTRTQFGFVPGCGTDSCQEALLLTLRGKLAAGISPAAAFIDLKAAYNRVDLTKLYQLIRDKGILSPGKLALLEFLHRNVEVTLGEHGCKPTNGVPQGFTTSPACFDIYIEPLIIELSNAGIGCLAYADDLVLVADDESQLRKGL